MSNLSQVRFVFAGILFLNLTAIAPAQAAEGRVITCSEGSQVTLKITQLPGQPMTMTEGENDSVHVPKIVVSRQGSDELIEMTRHVRSRQQCAEVLPTRNILTRFGYYLDGCLDSNESRIKMSLELNLDDPRDSRIHTVYESKDLDLITRGLFSSYGTPLVQDTAVQCSIEAVVKN
jgi:hypothetical protein